MRVPRTVDQLQQIPEMPPAMVKNCADDLLRDRYRSGRARSAPPVVSRPRPSPEQMALVKKLGALNQSIALKLGLSPEVLATRKDIESLAEGGRDVAILQGWRRK